MIRKLLLVRLLMSLWTLVLIVGCAREISPVIIEPTLPLATLSPTATSLPSSPIVTLTPIMTSTIESTQVDTQIPEPIVTPTLPVTPTPTTTETPTPILFLTVAAASHGCVLIPDEVDTLTVPMPQVLIGSSGSDEQFCILWHNDNLNVTAFVVEIRYENNGGVYSYTLPSDMTYVVLPENEAPNCSNRRSFHISVYTIVAESQRPLGGMGINDGCFE